MAREAIEDAKGGHCCKTKPTEAAEDAKRGTNICQERQYKMQREAIEAAKRGTSL